MYKLFFYLKFVDGHNFRFSCAECQAVDQSDLLEHMVLGHMGMLLVSIGTVYFNYHLLQKDNTVLF